MFVFDVSDTEPGTDAKPLPPEVEKPFEVRRGNVVKELDLTIENANETGFAWTSGRRAPSLVGRYWR